jgi:hypothetical protein
MLSEALDRPVQGEAKHLQLFIFEGINADASRSLPRANKLQTLRPSADGLRLTGLWCFAFLDNATLVVPFRSVNRRRGIWLCVFPSPRLILS